jgi:hypothetical protein
MKPRIPAIRGHMICCGCCWHTYINLNLGAKIQIIYESAK